MRIATIDIGTNTVLALDASSEEDEVRSTGDHIDIVRLGEGLDKSGRLSEAAMARALAVLSRHGERLRAEPPDVIRAVATEAVRKADNAAEFLARATVALGAPVEVIDGQREAQLSWLATTRSLPRPAPHPGGPRAVLEIGGGSTQLMIGDPSASAPARAVSLPIGSVRLTERTIHSDPPTLEDRRALVSAIDAALDGAPLLAPGCAADLVGIAGTVTTLCAIHLALATYDAERVHGARMSRAEVEAVVDGLGRSTQAERLKLPGLDAKRADVIFAGGSIAARVLERGAFSSLIVSDRGVRWGLAYEVTRAG